MYNEHVNVDNVFVVVLEYNVIMSDTYRQAVDTLKKRFSLLSLFKRLFRTGSTPKSDFF
jgi:hypothetical protein